MSNNASLPNLDQDKSSESKLSESEKIKMPRYGKTYTYGIVEYGNAKLSVSLKQPCVFLM